MKAPAWLWLVFVILVSAFALSLGVLREFEAVIGLTPAEADELAALAAVLEGEAI